MHGHPFSWGAVAAPAAPVIVEFLILCILVVSLASLHLLARLAEGIRALLNFEVPVLHKTVHLGSDIFNPVIRELDAAAKSTSHAIAGLWSDVADSFGKVLGLARVVANGMHTAVRLLWTSGIAQILAGPIGLVAGAVHLAYAYGKSAYDAVTDTSQPLPTKIANALSGAVHSAVAAAQTYTDTAIGGVSHDLATAKRSLAGDISGALTTAEGYTDSAVSALRIAEDAAVKSVRGIAQEAETAAKSAVSEAGSALTTAEGYTDTAVREARSALSGAIATAESTAEGAAAVALHDARAALDAAISDARAAATSAVNAAGGALTTAEGYVDTQVASAISTVRTDAAAALGVNVAQVEADIAAAKDAAIGAAHGALTDAQAAVSALRVAVDSELAAARDFATSAAQGVGSAATSAIDAVRSVAIDLGAELKTIEGPYGAVGLAALIASIPAIATLTHAIADEAGLGRQECRTKVKDICRTDPLAWAGLLAGIAAIGIEFDLGDLAKEAATAVGEVHGLVRHMGDGVINDAPAIGSAIGAVARGIAAAA